MKHIGVFAIYTSTSTDKFSTATQKQNRCANTKLSPTELMTTEMTMPDYHCSLPGLFSFSVRRSDHFSGPNGAIGPLCASVSVSKVMVRSEVKFTEEKCC